MATRDPLGTVEALDDAFKRRDVDGVLGFYEEVAAVVIRPGMTVEGQHSLRDAFQALFDSFKEPPIVKQLRTKVIEVDDVALFLSRWSISGTATDGRAISRVGEATSVLRRQADGTWRLVIDNPWGAAVLGPKDPAE